MSVAEANLSSPANAISVAGEPVLQLRGLVKQYPGVGHPAVADVSLSLQRGEILSLLGPSGCGKTTLLRMIAGFEPTDAGDIFIEGALMNRRPPEKRGVGMVFQDYALFPHLTVNQNVAFGLKGGGQKPWGGDWFRQASKNRKNKQQQAHRVQQVLSLVGLEDFGRRYPHELSGGQQQRIALARALAPAPSLVLLDEPMSNLDVQVRLRLRQELRDILKQSHTTAILVTHDQEEALSIADRIAVIRGGQVEQYGVPEEIYQSPASRFVADFVTQANFLPALQRELDLWETEIGCFRARLTGLGQAKLQPNKGEMMMRQEDIVLAPDSEGNGLVRDRQFLGREHRYTIGLASGSQLLVRMPVSQAIPVGTTVKVMIAQHTPQVFIESE